MMKSRSSLANPIRIVFASLFLGLFGALPAFATDGIYTKFGLDLGYAGRIGYMGGTTPEWAIYVYGAGTRAQVLTRWISLPHRGQHHLPWTEISLWRGHTAP